MIQQLIRLGKKTRKQQQAHALTGETNGRKNKSLVLKRAKKLKDENEKKSGKSL